MERDERLEPAGIAPMLEAARAATQARPRKVAKLLELVRALDSFSPGSKAVVFTRFRATLEAVSSVLSAEGVPHSSFHGGMSGPEKDQAVEELRNEVPVMLATDVGGEGRNLQFANVLVNYDLPWNPMKIEQRIGRLHRIGQMREVRVFSLCARGSAEERILDVLDRRIHLFELVIGEVDLILGSALDEKEFDARISRRGSSRGAGRSWRRPLPPPRRSSPSRSRRSSGWKSTSFSRSGQTRRRCTWATGAPCSSGWWPR
jgi:SNF2 family DNA or RNA helicase